MSYSQHSRERDGAGQKRAAQGPTISYRETPAKRSRASCEVNSLNQDLVAFLQGQIDRISFTYKTSGKSLMDLGYPLSQLKTDFRNRYEYSLEPELLGYSKVKDLIQSYSFADVSWDERVKNYVILPATGMQVRPPENTTRKARKDVAVSQHADSTGARGNLGTEQNQDRQGNAKARKTSYCIRRLPAISSAGPNTAELQFVRRITRLQMLRDLKLLLDSHFKPLRQTTSARKQGTTPFTSTAAEGGGSVEDALQANVVSNIASAAAGWTTDQVEEEFEKVYGYQLDLEVVRAKDWFELQQLLNDVCQVATVDGKLSVLPPNTESSEVALRKLLLSALEGWDANMTYSFKALLTDLREQYGVRMKEKQLVHMTDCLPDLCQRAKDGIKPPAVVRLDLEHYLEDCMLQTTHNYLSNLQAGVVPGEEPPLHVADGMLVDHIKSGFQRRYGYQLNWKAAGCSKFTELLSTFPHIISIKRNQSLRYAHPSPLFHLRILVKSILEPEPAPEGGSPPPFQLSQLKPAFAAAFGYKLVEQQLGFDRLTALMQSLTELCSMRFIKGAPHLSPPEQHPVNDDTRNRSHLRSSSTPSATQYSGGNNGRAQKGWAPSDWRDERRGGKRLRDDDRLMDIQPEWHGRADGIRAARFEQEQPYGVRLGLLGSFQGHAAEPLLPGNNVGDMYMANGGLVDSRPAALAEGLHLGGLQPQAGSGVMGAAAEAMPSQAMHASSLQTLLLSADPNIVRQAFGDTGLTLRNQLLEQLQPEAMPRHVPSGGHMGPQGPEVDHVLGHQAGMYGAGDPGPNMAGRGRPMASTHVVAGPAAAAPRPMYRDPALAQFGPSVVLATANQELLPKFVQFQEPAGLHQGPCDPRVAALGLSTYAPPTSTTYGGQVRATPGGDYNSVSMADRGYDSVALPGRDHVEYAVMPAGHAAPRTDSEAYHPASEGLDHATFGAGTAYPGRYADGGPVDRERGRMEPARLFANGGTTDYERGQATGVGPFATGGPADFDRRSVGGFASGGSADHRVEMMSAGHFTDGAAGNFQQQAGSAAQHVNRGTAGYPGWTDNTRQDLPKLEQLTYQQLISQMPYAPYGGPDGSLQKY